MNSAHTHNNYWLNRGLLTAVFILPIIVTPAFILEYHLGKWLIILGVIIATIIIALQQKHDFINNLPKNPVLLAFLTLGIMQVLWAIPTDFLKGFWGDALRLTGAWLWITLGLFAIWLSTVIKDAKTRNYTLKLVLTAGLIAGIFGVLVQFASDVFAIRVGVEGLQGRFVGLFGSATYLSSFLLSSVFLASPLLWIEKKTWKKYIVGAVLLLIVWFMFKAQTRGALIGMIMGAVAITVGYTAVHYKKIRWLKNATIGMVLIAFAWVYVHSLGYEQTQQISPAHPQYLAQHFPKEAGITTRFLLWDIALKGIADKPIFGWGTNQYETVFDTHYDPALFDFSASETWGERAHNHLLENTVNFGMLGAIAYLILIASPIWTVREDEDTQTTMIKLSILGLTVSYFGFNMFAFDTPSALLHLSLGTAVSASLTHQHFALKKFATRSAVPITILLIYIAFKGVIVPLQQSYHAQSALKANQTQSKTGYKIPLQNATQGTSLATQDILKLTTDQIVNNHQLIAPERVQQGIEILLPAYHTFNEKNPRYAMLIREAQLKALQAVQTKEGHHMQEAEEAFNRAHEVSPHRQTTLLSQLQMHLGLEQLQDAQIITDKLLASNPEYNYVYWISGMIHAASGNMERAGTDIATAIKMNYSNPNVTPQQIEIVLHALETNNDYHAIVTYLTRLFIDHEQVAPINSGLNHLRLATALANVGRYPEARSEASTALLLDPKLKPQIDELIRNFPN